MEKTSTAHSFMATILSLKWAKTSAGFVDIGWEVTYFPHRTDRDKYISL